MLMRVIYFSSQTYSLNSNDLEFLLEQCRNNNRPDNLTGLLIYKDGCFCQTVEGEERLLKRLIKRLQKDRRHKNILMLDYRPIEERQFARWLMAFENLNNSHINAMNLDDLNEYLHQKFELSDERDLLPHMLGAFSRSTEQLAS